MTIVSQSPHQISINTETKEESEEVVLKYNIEEINGYREERGKEE